jgi:hypothetical protein
MERAYPRRFFKDRDLLALPTWYREHLVVLIEVNQVSPKRAAT